MSGRSSLDPFRKGLALIHYKITYAQNREDLVLDTLLRSVAVGFYVDVGANHPFNDSVTKLFYDKGWCGINVEPHEHLIRELRAQRPRDINIQAGVSSQPGTMRLFTHSSDGLSTFSTELREMYLAQGAAQSGYLESSVEVVTLSDILRKHRPTGDIHFLKLDVEGLELEVLLGGSWLVFRPWVICLERGLNSARTAAINTYLGAWSYFPAFFDGLNDFYVANERRQLWDEFSYVHVAIGGGTPVHASIVPHLSTSATASVAQPTPPQGMQLSELLALDGEDFVRAAYATVLNRPVDPSGLTHFLDELNAGVSKVSILWRLSRSTEGRQRGATLNGLRLAKLREGLQPGSRRATKEARARQQASERPSEFHSKFGGLWIDRKDFPEQLAKRTENGKLPAHLAPALRDFERNGFVVLERAVPEDELARFEKLISAGFREGHPALLAQNPAETSTHAPMAGMHRRGVRIVDCYAALPAALDVLSAPRLVEFLELLFEERPKLFQSLSFDMGSEQGLHQDTGYVVVNRPLELVGCWIALEDVRPGSGELMYLVGSHRLPDFAFSGGRKHPGGQEGVDDHTAWLTWVAEESRRRGYPLQHFLAKRGDILLWHADLAHGGAPITDPSSTRKSLVGHFCPSSAKPTYTEQAPARATTLTHRGIEYCSWHYELAPPSGAQLRNARG
jgi:FkbM family methyltransferase